MAGWQTIALATMLSVATAGPTMAIAKAVPQEAQRIEPLRLASNEPNSNSGRAPNSSAEQRAARDWTTNDEGLALIETSEGLRLQAYNDGSTWRIGYGHSGGVTKGQTVTAAQAVAYLRADVKTCEIAIGQMVVVPVAQSEFSALVSLCYTTGAYSLRKSTVISRLNAGDRAGAADGFMLWVKSGGKPVPQLIARRTAERELFLK